MLVASVYSVDGSFQKVESIEAVAAAWRQPGIRVWIDMESADEQELLATPGHFPSEDGSLRECLHGEPWPRIDEFEEHIFLVLYGLFGLKEAGEVDPHKLAVFCGSRFLITVHRQPLLTVRQVKARCRRHPGVPSSGGGVDYVLCASSTSWSTDTCRVGFSLPFPGIMAAEAYPNRQGVAAHANLSGPSRIRI